MEQIRVRRVKKSSDRFGKIEHARKKKGLIAEK